MMSNFAGDYRMLLKKDVCLQTTIVPLSLYLALGP